MKLLIALGIFIFLFSCGASNPKSDDDKDPTKPPSWFYKMPKDPQEYYVVGYSKGYDEQDVKKSALEDAMSNVLFLIGVQITSQKTFEEIYVEKGGTYSNEKVQDKKIEIAGKGKIKNFKEIEYKKVIKPENKDLIEGYILLKIPKAEVQRASREIEEKARYLAENPTIVASIIQIKDKATVSNELSDMINQKYIDKGYYIITTDKNISKAASFSNDNDLIKYFSKTFTKEASWVILGLLRVNPHGKLDVQGMEHLVSATGTFTIKVVDLKNKKVISSESIDEKGFGKDNDRAIEDMISRIKQKVTSS